MTYLNKTLLFLTLLCWGNLFAQTPERKPGEALVQLQQGVSLTTFMANLRSLSFAQFDKPVAESWGMYKVRINEAFGQPETLLQQLQNLPGVRAAQWNHKTEVRNTEPNDTEWWRQENMTLINAPEAWDASTGGLTPNGDTIVVAILEKGAFRTHSDLIENWWFNWKEIPNNNKDDDNNGYVDDYHGYDGRFDGDWQGNNDSHGTSVNGIIGARGNNGAGVTGVNWRVKLLNVSNTVYEDEIIAAYQYVGNARQRYNQSNGQEGAFVVATNASFGIDYAKAEDYPLWCAVYDSLGAVGVLNVCATINANVDVDAQGDMPTTCPSEYMIAVTNVDRLGNKVPGAGYGATHIDLAAPGQDVYTTRVNFDAFPPTPTYGNAGDGTSFSTPLVSGTVALLYSLNCDKFASDALTDPSAAARRARDIILEHVIPETSLEYITTTGGRLDLAASVSAVRSICDGVVGPLELLEVKGTFGRGPLQVTYQTPDFKPYQVRIFNALGQLVYEEEITPLQFSINQYEFDYHNLPAGAYFFTLGRDNDQVVEKFLKI